MMRRCSRARPKKRRPKLPTRAERRYLPSRIKTYSRNAPRARRYDLWPGIWCDEMGGNPWSRVELRIASNRAWMLREAFLLGSAVATEALVQGCVISKHRKYRIPGSERALRGWRGRICTVLLNEVDLLSRPSEIVAHEMTHAAMVFMRVRGVCPSRGMPEEEALCYTVGELVKQANYLFYAHAYRRPTE